MWTVGDISSNRAVAEQIKELLTTEGVLVMIRPLGVPHLGDSGAFEVLVPELEAPEANDILSTMLPV